MGDIDHRQNSLPMRAHRFKVTFLEYFRLSKPKTSSPHSPKFFVVYAHHSNHFAILCRFSSLFLFHPLFFSVAAKEKCFSDLIQGSVSKMRWRKDSFTTSFDTDSLQPRYKYPLCFTHIVNTYLNVSQFYLFSNVKKKIRYHR